MRGSGVSIPSHFLYGISIIALVNQFCLLDNLAELRDDLGGDDTFD